MVFTTIWSAEIHFRFKICAANTTENVRDDHYPKVVRATKLETSLCDFRNFEAPKNRSTPNWVALAETSPSFH